MKKFTVVLIILALVATSAFASVFQIGGTARFGGKLTSFDDYKEISNYDFGADARLNLGFFGVAANVLFGKNNDNTVLNSIVTANVRFDMKVVDLAFGLGYSLPIEFGKDGILINDKPINEALDVLKNSQLLLRAALGANIGVLGLSIDYKIPFNTIKTYVENKDYSDLKSFQEGKIAVSVLANLF